MKISNKILLIVILIFTSIPILGQYRQSANVNVKIKIVKSVGINLTTDTPKIKETKNRIEKYQKREVLINYFEQEQSKNTNQSTELKLISSNSLNIYNRDNVFIGTLNKNFNYSSPKIFSDDDITIVCSNKSHLRNLMAITVVF